MMLKLFMKRTLSLKLILFLFVFFISIHFAGKILLGSDFSASVLHYYQWEYRYFTVIIKYLLPIIVFLFLFVFQIDLQDEYLLLVVVRNRNQYRHIIDISLFIGWVSVVYWGIYFFIFYLFSPSSALILFKELMRMMIMIFQVSSLYFCSARVVGNAQIATLISCVCLIVLSVQSEQIANLMTLSPIALLIIAFNLFLIVVIIRKKGVMNL